MTEVKTLTDLLSWLSPPLSVLNYLDSQKQKASPQSVEWIEKWKRINAGSPIPERDAFEKGENEPVDNRPPLPSAQLAGVRDEAIALHAELVQRTEELVDLYREHDETKQRFARSEKELNGLEAEAIVEDAQEQLAGIPKTSKAYAAALTVFLHDLHEGPLAEYMQEHRDLERDMQDLEIRLKQAQTRAASLRHRSELVRAILQSYA